MFPNHNLSLQPKIPPHKQNINHTKKSNSQLQINQPLPDRHQSYGAIFQMQSVFHIPGYQH